MVRVKSLTCLALLVATSAFATPDDDEPKKYPVPICPGDGAVCQSSTGIFRCVIEQTEGDDSMPKLPWTQCKNGTWTVDEDRDRFESTAATYRLGQFAALTIGLSVLSALAL